MEGVAHREEVGKEVLARAHPCVQHAEACGFHHVQIAPYRVRQGARAHLFRHAGEPHKGVSLQRQFKPCAPERPTEAGAQRRTLCHDR